MTSSLDGVILLSLSYGDPNHLLDLLLGLNNVGLVVSNSWMNVAFNFHNSYTINDENGLSMKHNSCISLTHS